MTRVLRRPPDSSTGNPAVAAVTPPPIADVNGWVADVDFPAERPLLNLAQAVPSYPPASELIARVGEVAAEPASALYAPILGLDSLRERFAEHIGEVYETTIGADTVCITAGCNQAFCSVLTALAGPGDEVILPVPWYFNHQMWLQMQGIVVRALPFSESDGGIPDVAAARELITPRTRALVLVSPNNPTGAEFPQQTIEAFLELAAAHGLVLVLDETYKDFRARAGAPHGLFDDPRWERHLVSLHSFSKSYAMAGYRVGAVVCGSDLMPQVEKVQDCVAICAPRLSQEAALFALRNLDGWRDGKVREMRDRVGALRDAFRANTLEYSLVSAGAYFAWVRHPFGDEPAEAVARRLAREHGVLSVPGSTFGPGLDAYLRLAFANVEASLMPAVVERLCESQGSV